MNQPTFAFHALLMSLALVSISANLHAQTPPTPPNNEEPALQEVVVTGSRIAQPNATSVSPIQVLSSQDIQLNGTNDISQLLNILPQQFINGQSDLGANQNPLTSAGGESNADLRGLGPQRTLVLVDGRRLGVGDASTLNPNPAPDLNQIPPQLVERVDVVTGGASAVYGSDAIAGVVNFIMKHDFQGIEVDGQYGIDQYSNHDGFMQSLETQAGFPAPTGSHWDGQNRNMSVIMGTNFADDKGNIEVYFTYRNADPVSQGSRDYSGCLLHVQPGGANPALLNQAFCDGSPNSNLIEPIFNPSPTAAYSVVGNSLLTFPQAGSVPPPYFNSEPYEYITVQDTRYNAGFFSHYDVNEYVKPFLDFSFMRDVTNSNIGPSGAGIGGNPNDPTGNGGFLVNCAPVNSLLSAQESATLCGPANAPAVYPSAYGDSAVDVYLGRRNIEGGPRTSDFEHENYRAVLGVKGGFADAWNYEAYGSFYSTSLFNSLGGYLSNSKIQNALLVGGTAAAPVCQGGQAGCVPWNIWTQGGVTPAQLAYLTTTGSSQGTVTERIISGDVTGKLGQYGLISPLATDGVAVNLGVEHRSEALNYAPDAEEQADDLAFFSGAGVPINNSYRVYEEFVEVRAPVVQHQPFVDQLTIGAAGRHSDYSTSGSVNTYKFDVEYAPISDVMLRGSYDRAIRAPNLIELYTPQSVTNTTVVGADPCAGATPSATLAACAHTGVTAAQYGTIAQCPAGQCATLTGGNPALQPEKADTLSVGTTYSPSYLQGFTASIDFYRIVIKQEVTNVPQDISLNECLAGNLVYCGSVVRTPAGALFGTTIAGGGYVVATNQNIASAEQSGIDLQLAYKFDVGAFGSLSANMAGTWLQNQKSQPIPTDTPYNCAGLFGVTCQTVNPRWRHVARFNWQTPVDLLVSLQWRYIGSTKLDNNTGNPLLATSAFGSGYNYDAVDARMPNVSYLDLSAIYTVSRNLSVRAGVNNLLDKDPPVISEYETETGAPNSYPTYDQLGRQMFVAATVKF